MTVVISTSVLLKRTLVNDYQITTSHFQATRKTLLFCEKSHNSEQIYVSYLCDSSLRIGMTKNNYSRRRIQLNICVLKPRERL